MSDQNTTIPKNHNTILITGAFGYVGYSVVEQLLRSQSTLKPQDLILFDNLQSRNNNFFHNHGRLGNTEQIKQIYFSDILDNNALLEAMDGVDIVIHLAAKASTPFSDSQAHSFDQINNWGTAALADAIERSPSVKSVVYLSTVSVYGNTEGQTVNESYIPDPHSFYGISKLKGERHIQRIRPEVKKIIVRSGNVFGYNPCFRTDAVINRFAFDAHFKHKILINGSGEQTRAFVSIDRIAKYINEIIQSPKDYPEIINMVDHNLSVLDIAEHVFQVWPGTEYVHSGNHMRMRSIAVESKYRSSDVKAGYFRGVLEGFRGKFMQR